MSTIKRQEIIDAVITRISGITTPTYYSTFTDKVWEYKTNPFETDQLDGVTVADFSQSLVEEESSPMGTHVYDLDLTVLVVSKKGQNTLSWLRKAEVDINKAFKTDLTFGGLAMITRYVGSQITVDEKEKFIGGIEIKYTIRYETEAFQED